MIATIRTEKKFYGAFYNLLTRQRVAESLGLSDGSHIDRIMAGYPVLMMPRKDGKAARMYHKSDVFDVQHKRRHNAPELFDRKPSRQRPKTSARRNRMRISRQ